MSVVKEMIIFTASLLLTVSLLFVSYRVYGKAVEFGNELVRLDERKLAQVRQEAIEKYEGQETKGNLIISYAKDMYKNEDIPIRIKTEYREYILDDVSVERLRNPDSGYYINPFKTYRVSIQRDKNDSIKEIKITETN